jgi:ribonuclease P protein component
LENGLGYARIGITATKRHGNSVERNRIKRIIRAAVRSSMPLLINLGYDIVVIPKKGILGSSSTEISPDLDKLVTKLR